jgi:hypothetical protein
MATDSGYIGFTDAAVAGYNLLMRQPDEAAALELASKVFPGMPEAAVLALYRKDVTPTFSSNGNIINVEGY